MGFLEINPKEVNFRDIVMDRIEKKEKIKSTTKYLKGKEYWLNKIDKMPDRPLLPIIQSKDKMKMLHLNDMNSKLLKIYGIT